MEIKNGTYRHFKGGTVEVLGVAKHSEEGQEPVVVYVGLQNGKLCARPISSFTEKVKNAEGVEVSRFALVEESRKDVIKEIVGGKNKK